MTRSIDPRGALGRAGEELAAQHLQRHGLEILARRARTPAGELDVVAYADETIVFVEVKTRRAGAHGAALAPLEAVDARKRARVRRAGAAWLAEQRARPYARRIRFDAIGVTIDARGRMRALAHVRDAF